MYRRWQRWLGISALALGALVLTTTPAAAQRFGRYGGNNVANFGQGWGLNYAPGYGVGLNNTNAWNGYYGNGYYGNGYYGNGYYGNNGWYGRGYGNNWNSNGYYPDTYADYEPNYYYGQAPQYQSSGYSSFYPAEETPRNAALVRVQVPRDAELWFGGDKTSQTGSERDFVTPELKQDKDYFYTLKARWTDDNGKAVERTKRVQVRPGAHIMVDFNRNTNADTDRGEKREQVSPTNRAKPAPEAKPAPNTPRNKDAVP